MFIDNYKELIKILHEKNRNARKVDVPDKEGSSKPKEKKIDVKVLKKPNAKQNSEEMIFQSALEAKGISHEIY